MRFVIGAVGILLIIVGLGIGVGLGFNYPNSATLSTVTNGCVTFNTANPSSNTVSTPTQWNTNQAQNIATQITLVNCSPATTQAGQPAVPFTMQLQCSAGCGSAPQYPLTPTGGQSAGTIQEFLSLTSVSPQCSQTTTCTGWLNYTWSAAGEGVYSTGATFSVTWTVLYYQGINIAFSTTAYSKIGGIIGQPQDFGITALNIAPFNSGTTATSTVTVSPINGFSASVVLSVSCQTSSGGVTTALNTCLLVPTLVGGGQSLSSTLSVGSTCCIGSYQAVVTGTSSNLIHSVTIPFTVLNGGTGTSTPDFTISSNTATITFNVGANGVGTLTVTPINSFTGTITFTATVSGVNGAGTAPAGSGCSVSPTTVTLGNAQSITLTLTATQPINFGCIITGTSGTLSHSLSLVTGFSSGTGSSATYSLISFGVPDVFIVIGIIMVVGDFGFMSKSKSLRAGK
jgi:hypothetical protein